MIIATHKKKGISLIPKQPAVSIILPFEPKMASYRVLEENIMNAFGIAESELLKYHPAPESLPVINRLRCLLKRINYNTHKKSIAIFASADFEKIFYLNIQVEEAVIVKDSFQLKDLIRAKNDKKEFLALVLDKKNANIHIGNGSGLIKLILHNTYEMEENSNYDDKLSIEKYYAHLDKSLSIVMRAYSLPVFVIGNETAIRYFSKISENKKNIVRYITVDSVEITSTRIQEHLFPHINKWDKIKQLLLLRRMKEAIKKKRIKLGINDVWESTAKKNAGMLIIEDNIFNNVRHLRIPINIFSKDSPRKNPFYIKDPVDDVIEKTLDNGGEIEFCEKGMLTNHGHIALITQY